METSIRIARRWKIPPSVIAVTIISAGTSAPEFFVSFIAGFKEQSVISVGNIIGSNIFNILVVGGVSFIIQPYILVKETLFSWFLLLLSTLIFFFSLKDYHINFHEASILLFSLFLFIFFSLFQKKEKNSGFENLESVSMKRNFFFFFLSLGGLILGARLSLSRAIELGTLAGLSHQVIAITILSVGTGLPELATSIAAAFRKHGDIAIANVIGSNIFNSLGIPGMTAVFFPLDTAETVFSFDFYIMVAGTLGLALFYIFRTPLPRKWFGGIMLAGYFAYMMTLL